MNARNRGPQADHQEPDPCPLCQGEGIERRWEYDLESRTLFEANAPCLGCGGTGRAPPRVEVRPDLPPCWAWEMGELT